MIRSTLSEFGGPEVLRVETAPDPVPDAREIAIAVHASGVNRADLLQRAGHYPPPPGEPSWPGLEVAGTVVSAGDAVSRWRPGDRVCALLAGGGYATRVAVHEDLVLPAPDGLTWEEAGGLVEAACTAWSNLETADARAGETLLVEGGSGGVGHIAVQLGVALGMRVLATAGGTHRAERVAALGAEAIDHTSGDVAEQVRERGGVDVILDVLGAGALDPHLRMLNPDGRLVVIGMQSGRRGELDLGRLLSTRARVIGTTLRARPHEQKARIVREVEQHVWPHVPERIRPVVHEAYPLDRAGDAHRALDSGEVFGKLVLTPPA